MKMVEKLYGSRRLFVFLYCSQVVVPGYFFASVEEYARVIFVPVSLVILVTVFNDILVGFTPAAEA